MAFNNGFPMSYQPQYMYPQYPQQVQTATPTAQNNSSIVWVQGEAGAKAYPVAAGNSVLLLDSESSVFYIKSTDVSGMPMPLRTFDFVERTGPVIEQSSNTFKAEDYVSRKEFEEFKETMNQRRKDRYSNGKSVE